ncbi:circularly permuted type 2 ATP-grasp protein, partial [Pseudomonas sp. R2.Fl]|nr:circularly permuted type 2 ATP-grasp protein [Pseudomonas sp. R2.Fl]
MAFDEMMTADDTPRDPYKTYFEWYSGQDPAHLIAKSRDAENIFRKTGITFAVYGHADSSEKLIPFDIIPRIISASEWRRLAQGIEQRVLALNAFLDDIYHKQEIIRAGRIPRELIEKNDAFLPEMIGFRPPGGVYTHIVGTDIVRT